MYCLTQVHNAAIIASGQDINYKKDEGGRGGASDKRALGKGAGVVVGEKRRKASSDQDDEEEAEEEYGVWKRGGKGGDGVRGGSKRKKDSREEDGE